MALVTAQMRTDVAGLYAALFGRAPESDGLGYWVDQLANGGRTLDQVAQSMYDTAPARVTYPLYLTNTEIVTKFYQNVLGTTDPDGIAYWAAKLNAGESKGQLINELVTAVTKYSGTDAAALARQATFNNKVTVGLYYAVTLGGNDVSVASTLLTNVDSTAASVTAAESLAQNGVGKTFTLTTGVDAGAAFTGGTANDTFNAQIGGSDTLTALDSIDGGAGSDTLNILDLTGGTSLPNGITVSNIETINVRSAGNVAIDLTAATGVTGVTSLVTNGMAGGDVITVGAGTAVNATNTAGNVTVHGNNSAVTVNAKGMVIIDTGATTETVTTAGGVALSKATGAVTVTDTAQGTANSTIDDGTSVTMATTYTATNSGQNKVTIGGSAKPTGAVSLTETVTGSKTADTTAGDITINGGSTVTVTQNATQALNDPNSTPGGSNTNHTLNESNTTVDGGSATTSVTVSQTASTAVANTTTALAGVAETDVFTFTTLANGATATVAGLTFTNTSGSTLTVAQVAAAFANLSAGATHGSSTLGAYSGAFTSGWSTGAVSATNTVTATDASAVTHVGATLTAAGGASVALGATGLTGVSAAAGTAGIQAGAVWVNDANYNTGNANTITTVSVNGYNNNNSGVWSSALSSLSLANDDAGATFKAAIKGTDASASSTLSLTVNNLASGSAVNLDAGTAGVVKTLNIHTTGSDSAADITATGVTALTIDGTKALNLTSSTAHLAALKTVTVSGSAGVTGDFSGANVTDVNASATSGNVTASVDASKATYEGGSGTDTVTLTSTTVSKAITLGAGDDKITLADALGTVITPTATIDGGTGTNTISMSAADAAAFSGSSSFQDHISNFQKLGVGAVAAGASKTVDLANMDGISYVISAGGTASGTVTGTLTNTNGVAATSAEIEDVALSAGLVAGQSVTLDGLTVTSTITATATQVASVFAGGTVAGLTLSGSALTPSGWTGTPTIDNSGGAGHVTFTNTVQGDVVTTAADFAVTSTGGNGALTLSHMANAGTLELTGNATGGVTVSMTDASGTSDSFNIAMNGATTTGSTVTVNGVESVAISTASAASALTLADNAVKTITITGSKALTLTTTGDTTLTTVNGSAMTGALTYTTAGTVAETVTGGSGNDALTAKAGSIADVLIGGAGNDVLTSNAGLDTLTGGAGADVFVITTPGNVNSYATVTDAAAGDRIAFANMATETFTAAKISLAATAVFQDYANAAVNAGGNAGTNGYIAWFQYGGDTYVVESRHDATTTHDFQNGTDVIVKLTGTVDLSTATLNTGDGTYGATIMLH